MEYNAAVKSDYGLVSEVHGIITDVILNKNTSHKIACTSAMIKYTFTWGK